MSLSILLAGFAVLLLVIHIVRPLSKLNHLPGPRGLPFFGSQLSISLPYIHQTLASWSKIYGPVFRYSLSDGERVVVNDYESIYKVFVASGKDFGARPSVFRTDMVFKHTGILFSTKADKDWKSLRKFTQKHLKQYGEGLSCMENIIRDVGEYMFEGFKDSAEAPCNPRKLIFDTALSTVCLLVTGVRMRSGEPLLDKMRRFERDFLRYCSTLVSPIYLVYDYLPWLRHFGLTSWQKIQEIVDLQEDIWKDVKMVNSRNPEAESLLKALFNHIPDPLDDEDAENVKAGDVNLSELDVHKTSLSLLNAGVSSTSATFYACINFLAHRPDVQQKMFDEIQNISPDGREIGLDKRPRMPFTRAVLLEVLRVFTVGPLAVPHKTVCDTTISGYYIPKGTTVAANLWALHHDPDFWVEPDKFIPERFLDEDGEVVHADHPNRKHLMPFGAGTRVCVGQSLAQARLFLWINTLVQRFQIRPVKKLDVNGLNATKFKFEIALRVPDYEVYFHPR